MTTPDKLIIEPTTRCNFKCRACVKQSAGCRIAEGDMPLSLFDRLSDLFPFAHTLTLTGIGEPLMHRKLEQMAARAAAQMKDHTVRGIQTNGKLLTPDRARSLIDAGLNRICISVDASDPGLFSTIRPGGSLSDVAAALESLDMAQGSTSGSGVQKGLEFVLMKKNMDQLPRVVAWAGQRGVDFILVTHVTAYTPETEGQQVFMDNSEQGLHLFGSYRKKAAELGLDLEAYGKIVWKFYKTEQDQAVCHLVQEMKKEALSRGIYLNLFHLLTENQAWFNQITDLFARSRDLARRFEISLTLPGIRPRTKRHCPFVEDGAMFVTREGQVSPCYFLWHGYQTMRQGYVKTVNPVHFGSIDTQLPGAIWSGDPYREFRDKVRAYDYPNCHSWCETRCDYVLEDPFTQDCFINDIPCCDCHWSLGFLTCLN